VRNPFNTPLPATAVSAARETGRPDMEGYAFPSDSNGIDTENHPDYTGSLNTPLPYHGTTGERFQSTNPGYAGEYHPSFLDNPGPLPAVSHLAPAPGSENLRAPRDSNSKPGTNRLFKPSGPVDGGNASPGWTGKNAALRTPVVGNSGPVSGGRDGAQIAAQAYFAAQAAQFSQAASDAAMVSVL
jgi:hypothetical protein